MFNGTVYVHSTFDTSLVVSNTDWTWKFPPVNAKPCHLSMCAGVFWCSLGILKQAERWQMENQQGKFHSHATLVCIEVRCTYKHDLPCYFHILHCCHASICVYRILLNKCACLNKRAPRHLTLTGYISKTTELIWIIFSALWSRGILGHTLQISLRSDKDEVSFPASVPSEFIRWNTVHV